MGKSVYKIVVIGEARVGKTSISVRYTQDTFDPNSPSTTDACCLERVHLFSDNLSVTLSIWDTAGQQKYNALVPVYYRDAKAALIVYDITCQQSFEKVRKWVKELKKYSQDETVIIVVGNKLDMGYRRTVPKEEVEQFAKQNKLQYYQVSAKTGERVCDVFNRVAQKIRKAEEQKQLASNRPQLPNSKFKKSRLTIEGEIKEQQGFQLKGKQVKEQSQKKCCS